MGRLIDADAQKGWGGMKELSAKHFTKSNKDNLDKAIEGLDQFTKNWCMNCKETEEKNEPIFRCSECNFRDALAICLIKEFVIDKTGDMPTDFGAMGSH